MGGSRTLYNCNVNQKTLEDFYYCNVNQKYTSKQLKTSDENYFDFDCWEKLLYILQSRRRSVRKIPWFGPRTLERAKLESLLKKLVASQIAEVRSKGLWQGIMESWCKRKPSSHYSYKRKVHNFHSLKSLWSKKRETKCTTYEIQKH